MSSAVHASHPGCCRLLALAAGLLLCTAARCTPVTIVVGTDGAPYRDAADAVQRTLAHLLPEVTTDVVTVQALLETGGHAIKDASLVVTVGTAAASATVLAAGDFDLLSILIPRQAYESLHCEAALAPAHHCTAIYLDQPLRRQLNLVQAALPERHRVGVVLGNGSRDLLPALLREAPAHGQTLAYRVISEPAELYPSLQAVMAEAEVFLALPDALVLSAITARSLLVSSYRQLVPVVGSSENYVRAGAMLAVYSTPRQIGEQAGESIAAAGGRLPPGEPQYPKYYQVQANYQVAHSLGIAVDDEAKLRERLAGMRE